MSIKKPYIFQHFIGKQTHNVNMYKIYLVDWLHSNSIQGRENRYERKIFIYLSIKIIIKYLSETREIDIHCKSIGIANSNRETKDELKTVVGEPEMNQSVINII